jgi:solute carrier family 8 (sodium/calcium exchanger)
VSDREKSISSNYRQDDTADASVGNVTGSNAVNVFLGIGIAWSLAAIYWTAQGEEFVVPVGR